MPTRVLIVDDHEVVREGLRALLNRREGMEVVGQAGTVADAIAEAARMEPDVIVMDVRLPDGSGIEACRAIREARPETRVIMLTSTHRPGDLERAEQLGIAAHLGKPIRQAVLMDTIAEVFGRARRSKGLVWPDLRPGWCPRHRRRH